mmetsp:Transcript_39361/g.80623  ORF Transcript_39361/g.80623 Transcript_39361/m.80623 type:complete len:272 (+) Transcript_39361:1589-2404(+)
MVLLRVVASVRHRDFELGGLGLLALDGVGEVLLVRYSLQRLLHLHLLAVLSDEVECRIHVIQACLRHRERSCLTLCRHHEVVDDVLAVTETPVLLFEHLGCLLLGRGTSSGSKDLLAGIGGAAVAGFGFGEDNALKLGLPLGKEALLAFSEHAKVEERESWNVHRHVYVKPEFAVFGACRDEALEGGTQALAQQREGEEAAQQLARHAHGVQDDERRVPDPVQSRRHILGVEGVKDVVRVADDLRVAPCHERHAAELVAHLFRADRRGFVQ